MKSTALLLTSVVALTPLSACSLMPQEAGGATVPQAVQMMPRKPAPSLADPCTPLRTAGVTSCQVEWVSSSEPRGKLLEQTPAAGGEASGANVVLKYSKGPESATLPPLKNKRPEDARALLYGLGLNASKTEEVDTPTVPQGAVVGVKDHKEGEVLSNGTDLTLQVSSGLMNIPDWRGKDLRTAQVSAAALGVKLVPKILATPKQKPGLIYLQDPAGGRTPYVKTVEVTIAKPYEDMGGAVPYVEGMPVEDAVAILTAQGFRNIKQVPGPADTATNPPQVLTISPAPGTRVINSAPITITVSPKATTTY